jgi:hypothetical protein
MLDSTAAVAAEPLGKNARQLLESVSYAKRKRITEQQIQEYLRLLKALPIRVESQHLWANVALESLARSYEGGPLLGIL